ncbi:TerB family tellurite resistance protein [Zobellia amurskyensis]|uniref:TerB family tellurite resistance protein n=1 Tax=Zobellia amurskyensis TaxID=248905 RepID=A0A7X3D2C5_9FLAO|nr:TerB family tellurite resistance protein [Zobellia amurskyensis]MUH37099.1 TerB family tellurite resistance protein [Zobellia amurskyensis]
MQESTAAFTLAEKLAMVHVVNSVILADGYVHDGEINAVTQLMQEIDFDSNFIMQARNIESEQAISILKQMPSEKKKNLENILEMTAISDGFKHTKETSLMTYIFESMNK